MKRDFLKVSDLTSAEIRAILKRALLLKKSGQSTKPLAGKVVALVFQKPSMRTRVAFEVAVNESNTQHFCSLFDEYSAGILQYSRDLKVIVASSI